MSDSDFERIGKLLRDKVQPPESDSARAMLRTRVVEQATRQRPARYPAFAFAAAAALLAVVGVVIALGAWRTRPPPISFRVGDTPMTEQPGTYLAPVGSQVLSLRFSEGSVIVLEPQARARIAQTTPQGASFQLETGRARFQIAHREGTDWTVFAGPYDVRVRGTAFTASWDASTETFELTLESGSVLVRGPGIEAGIQLDGEQHFVGRPRASAKLADSAELPPTPPSASCPAASASHADVGMSPSAAGASTAPPASRSVASNALSHGVPAADSWPALAARGEYRRILEQAEQSGVSSSIAQSSQADLWALAEAARLSGRGALARQALMAVRSRFSGSSQAASAAFLLGRMSDDGGAVGDAISWYDRYMAEAPGGSFVPEASGRRMVALRKSGRSAEATQAAAAYLQRFPSGPYAGVARDLVGP